MSFRRMATVSLTAATLMFFIGSFITFLASRDIVIALKFGLGAGVLILIIGFLACLTVFNDDP